VAEVDGRAKKLDEGGCHWEREDGTRLEKYGTDVLEGRTGVNKDRRPERHHRRMRLATAVVLIAKSSQKYEFKPSREGLPDIST
jgi:hypothetical protein